MTKLVPAGDMLSFSTYLGGSGNDYGQSIAVTGGHAYVTGSTTSHDFPSKNPYQRYNGGGEDAFVTKLGAGGNTLIYSTYLGGSKDDEGLGIAVGDLGNAYVTGSTVSTVDFPRRNPYQAVYGGGSTDAFVAKFSEPRSYGVELLLLLSDD